MAYPARSARAQSQTRDSTIAHFSRDLAALQSLVDSLAYYHRTGGMAERSQAYLSRRESDGIMERLVAAAAVYAEKWKDDPYVTIEGFDVEMGLDPSLSVHFRFKEVPGQHPATR